MALRCALRPWAAAASSAQPPGAAGVRPLAAAARASEVLLPDGARLPCEALGGPAQRSLVWGHGLGVQEPWSMGRRTCESFDLVSEAVQQPEGHHKLRSLRGQQQLRGPRALAAAVRARCGPRGGAGPARARRLGGDALPANAVIYDARGHGDSTGWEPSAGQIQQFHWRSLAVDMLLVAAQRCPAAARGGGALLGGYSMGASSALWAACLCPTSVRGLVLLSVTTAWEVRAARRGALLEAADGLEAASRGPAASVVRGAAFADLPPLEDIAGAGLRMPALLACARDDPTHPAEVIERLATVLPSAAVEISETTEELRGRFPGLLRAWLRRHGA